MKADYKFDFGLVICFNALWQPWVAKGHFWITTKDIAYLSAATHHEFALLRGKKQDILFHGTNYHCNITDDMVELLQQGKLYLVAHTHPDYGTIKPSANDRKFLQRIGQKKSLIVSYITGVEREFSDDDYRDL